MDPSPPADLCPECGAYWTCEHRATSAPAEALEAEPTQTLTDQIAGAWQSFSQAVATAVGASLQKIAAFLNEEDDKDPEWAEWAHAGWQGIPHRFRPVRAVDAAISAAAATLDWHAERPRAPPFRRSHTLLRGEVTIQIGRPPTTRIDNAPVGRQT